MTESEFIDNIKNVKGSRKHEFSNSYTVRDYYWYFRKYNKELTETQFSSILEELLKRGRDLLINGKDFKFPGRFGMLEIRKRERKVKIVDGKLKVNLPINWNETLKLWYSDEKAKQKRTLVRCDVPSIFGVNYNKRNALYKNKAFIEFRTNREFKLLLKKEIQNNKNFDAFAKWRKM